MQEDAVDGRTMYRQTYTPVQVGPATEGEK